MMLSNTDMIYATYEPFNHSACLCNVIATQCYWSQCYWDISGAVLWSVFLTPPVTPLCIVCSDRTYVSRGNLSWKSGPSNAFEIFSKSFSSEAYCGKCISVSKWKLHLSHRAASLSSFPHETLKIYVWENLTKFPENGNKGCSLKDPAVSPKYFRQFWISRKILVQADFLHSCGTGIQKSSWGQREREKIYWSGPTI